MTTALPKDDLITGEAVVVALPYAGLALRVLSGAIDVALQSLLLVLGGLALSRFGRGLDEALTVSFGLLTGVVCVVALPALCEGLTGRTLGKKLTGLRTVRSDGGPVDGRRALTRALIGVVEIWLTTGAVALLTGLVTEPTRRLGDLAAGTYVARERIRLRLPLPPAMPPQLSAWAGSADVALLPDELALLVRSTLAQRAQFNAETEHRVLSGLADRVGAHVSPPPPAGTTPGDFLDAVLAERRRRETVRLQEQLRRRDRLFGSVPAEERVGAEQTGANRASVSR